MGVFGDGRELWDGSVYEELHSRTLLWRGKTVEKSAVHGAGTSFLPLSDARGAECFALLPSCYRSKKLGRFLMDHKLPNQEPK